ncbi:MAG: flagellar export chaperone FliS [Bacillota bacterium]|jgi:flagellar protein FliS
MFANGYERYRQVQLETASPIELIVKLYDGAIRFVVMSEKALVKKDYNAANTWLLRAQDIIDELNYNLNMDTGEIAQNLRDLYLYFNKTLMEANVKKDSRNLKTIIEMLTSLRDAWTRIGLEQRRSATEKQVLTGI